MKIAWGGSSALGSVPGQRRPDSLLKTRTARFKRSADDSESDRSNEEEAKESNPCVDLLCEKLADVKLELHSLYLNRCELHDEDAMAIIKTLF